MREHPVPKQCAQTYTQHSAIIFIIKNAAHKNNHNNTPARGMRQHPVPKHSAETPLGSFGQQIGVSNSKVYQIIRCIKV